MTTSLRHTNGCLITQTRLASRKRLRIRARRQSDMRDFRRETLLGGPCNTRTMRPDAGAKSCEGTSCGLRLMRGYGNGRSSANSIVAMMGRVGLLINPEGLAWGSRRLEERLPARLGPKGYADEWRPRRRDVRDGFLTQPVRTTGSSRIDADTCQTVAGSRESMR